jgi:hypothetical protein
VLAVDTAIAFPTEFRSVAARHPKGAQPPARGFASNRLAFRRVEMISRLIRIDCTEEVLVDDAHERGMRDPTDDLFRGAEPQELAYR